jgi:hypothetical protein
MNGLLSLAACAIIATVTVWLFGGFVLRACGALLAFGGVASTALTGSPRMAVAAILGGLAWLAGQWLFGLRHHYYRSPLARRFFLQWLPARLDPTRGWGVPNVPPGCRR